MQSIPKEINKKHWHNWGDGALGEIGRFAAPFTKCLPQSVHSLSNKNQKSYWIHVWKGRIQGWQSNWKFKLENLGNKGELHNLKIKSTQICQPAQIQGYPQQAGK